MCTVLLATYVFFLSLLLCILLHHVGISTTQCSTILINKKVIKCSARHTRRQLSIFINSHCLCQAVHFTLKMFGPNYSSWKNMIDWQARSQRGTWMNVPSVAVADIFFRCAKINIMAFHRLHHLYGTAF